MKLYGTALSGNGRKPIVLRALLDQQLGERVEIVEVNVYAGEGRSPDYLEINPWGKIPTLVDGELVLWESNAILVYLAEIAQRAASAGERTRRVWPGDPAGRADVLRWLFWEASHWQPAFVEVLEAPLSRVVQAALLGEEPECEEVEVDRPSFAAVLDSMERRLTDQPCVCGEAITLADVSLSGMMMYLDAVAFPWQRFPHVEGWWRGLQAREAWRSTAVPPFLTPS